MFADAPPDLVLQAYRQGIFPMADSADAPDFSFYRPELRALLPIKDLHIPKRLGRTLRRFPYRVSADEAFETVIDACAREKKGREKTWINRGIREVFVELHRLGHAHSIECWDAEGSFAGGLYGLAVGRVFCGESMVSFKRDASKIALAHLCARLHAGGFTVLDTQFSNPHLLQFGLYEIPQEDYEKLIAREMKKRGDFTLEGRTERDLLEEYLSGKD